MSQVNEHGHAMIKQEFMVQKYEGDGPDAKLIETITGEVDLDTGEVINLKVVKEE